MLDYDHVPRLSLKQKAFIGHYLTTWNAAEAARRAGYTRGTSAIGSILLAKYNVRQEINKHLESILVGADETNYRIGAIARGSIRPFLSASGETDLTSPEAQANLDLIKKIKVRTKQYDDHSETETEIEIYDRLAALALLARIHGLTRDEKPDAATTTNNTLIITSAADAISKAGLNVQDVLAELPAIIAELQRMQDQPPQLEAQAQVVEQASELS